MQIPVEGTQEEEKDVTIRLNPLSLAPERPQEQSPVLSEVHQIFDSALDKEIDVIVINKNTIDSTSFTSKIRDVRNRAISVAQAYHENVRDAKLEDFIVVEIYPGAFKVSMLVEPLLDQSTERHE